MGVAEIPPAIRVAHLFSHIDMGFLNRRLGITWLGPLREVFFERQKQGNDHMAVLSNDHLLVTMLIDKWSHEQAPTLAEAIDQGVFPRLFMSIERLYPCRSIYRAQAVRHQVRLEFTSKKIVEIAYHTSHLVSDTGTMTLHEGYKRGYREAIIGIVHERDDVFEIQPIVIGAPWLDHPRNQENVDLMWHGHDYGEVLPEDIKAFERLREIQAKDADEWMAAMRAIPEEHVKQSIASLLGEPTKKDWGGEENDHYSSNVILGERRCTAAFMFKGPAKFREMTPAMCGKNGDQLFRLTRVPADVYVVQHAHLIGAAVRETLRSLVVTPGRVNRKYCLLDGQTTYRLLKAYDLLRVT